MGGLCGVIAWDGSPIGRETMEHMASESAFRGPDGCSIHVDDSWAMAALAHHTTPEARHEQQPLFSRDGHVCLVADARVDNRRELISQLDFCSEFAPTDADLILAAYLRWGKEFPERVVGDYAIAIRDGRTRTALLVRDAMGSRPLHYHWTGQRLAFASDATQILTLPWVPNDLDGYRIVEFLTFDFRPRPRTVFAAIQSVLPGHAIAFQGDGTPWAWRHWRPHVLPPVKYPLARDYVCHFRELLETSVADRLRVHHGRAAILLSGGLDSSAVTALAAHNAASTSPLPPICYTKVLPYPEMREVSCARDVAQTSGLQLQELELGQGYPFGEFVTQGLTHEGPWLTTCPIDKGVASDLATWDCSVLLNGFGGDSLFDAARMVCTDYMRSGRWSKVLPWIREAIRTQGRPDRAIFHYALQPLLPPPILPLIDRLRGIRRGLPFPHWGTTTLQKLFTEIQHSESRTLPRKFRMRSRQFQWATALHQGYQSLPIMRWNRIASRSGLELRMPLMDRRLAEFVLASPIELGAAPGPTGTKWLLRESTSGLLPETSRLRMGKTGGDRYLNAGLHQWFATSTLEGEDLILGQLGLIDSRRFKDALRNLVGSRRFSPSASQIFPPLLTECWLRYIGQERPVIHRQLDTWSLEQERGED